MKIFKTILIVLLVLFLIVVGGITVFLKTFDTSKIKTLVCQNLKETIDRDVSMGDIKFSLDIFKGVVLKVFDFTILDSPAFSKEYFLKVKEANVDLNTLAFLTKRQVQINSINVIEPQIRLIRTSDGKMNIPEPKASPQATSAQVKSKNSSTETSNAAATQAPGSSPQENPLLKALVISALNIRNGNVIVTDQSSTPALTIPIEHLDIEIKDLNFNSAFPISLKCSLFSGQPNIDLAANLRIFSDFTQINLQNSQLKTDLAQLDLSKMMTTVPALAPAGIEKLEGNMTIAVSKVDIVHNVLAKLDAHGETSDVKVALKYFPSVDHMNLKFDMDETNIRVTDMMASIAQGKITGKATILSYLTNPGITAAMSVDDLQLADLTQKLTLPAKTEGIVSVKFDANTATIDPKAITNALSATATFNITKGKIVDLNILRLVLSRMTVFPGLVDKLEQTLSSEYKDKLNNKDTIIDQFVINAGFSGGKTILQDVTIGADGFLVHAEGNMDMDQNLDLTTTFRINQDLSQSMIDAQDKFAYLQDQDKRINIPILPYKGKLKDLKIIPDVAAISKQAFENKGKEELQKAIFKALKIENKEPSSQETTQQQQQPTEQQSPEKAIIKNVLDSIFK